MKKLSLLLICCGLLFFGCSPEPSQERFGEAVNFKTGPDISSDCIYDSTILVYYDQSLTLNQIDTIRNEYLNQEHPCWEIEMALLQSENPYIDRWVTYNCACYPDGDSDDLDTTIDEDPRLSTGS